MRISQYLKVGHTHLYRRQHALEVFHSDGEVTNGIGENRNDGKDPKGRPVVCNSRKTSSINITLVVLLGYRSTLYPTTTGSQETSLRENLHMCWGYVFICVCHDMPTIPIPSMRSYDGTSPFNVLRGRCFQPLTYLDRKKLLCRIGIEINSICEMSSGFAVVFGQERLWLCRLSHKPSSQNPTAHLPSFSYQLPLCVAALDLWVFGMLVSYRCFQVRIGRTRVQREGFSRGSGPGGRGGVFEVGFGSLQARAARYRVPSSENTRK